MDPGDDELREWIDSIESVLETEGPERAKALFRAVRDYLSNANVIIEDATLNTPHNRCVRNQRPLICFG